MNKMKRFHAILLLACAVLNASHAFAQNPQAKRAQQAQAASTPVAGSGTPGQVTKWTGVSGENTFTVGDSIITETKFGLIGIGTTAPSSKLSVFGTIESLNGGFKFPDGTVQTSAGVSSIFRDATLIGNGTAGSPLGIAPGGVGNLQLGNGAVNGRKIAVPLSLSGATTDPDAVLSVTNTSDNILDPGAAIHATGGAGFGTGGAGVVATGGKGSNTGGAGIRAFGNTGSFIGGDGVFAEAGDAENGGGAGAGVTAIAGSNTTARGGSGVRAFGGFSISDKGGEGIFIAAGESESGIGGDAVVAVAGSSPAGNGFAGSFFGDVSVQGSFNVTGTKNFKIDHPLDPANKYLYHAAIESSEVLNIYSGNVTTDANGEAAISLPDWFEVINSDLRYQLTVVGQFAQAIVADEVRNNRFTIKTSAPNVKVSWQVTGVRSDSAMRKHPFKVVEEKSGPERGHYLSPEAFDQPEEKSVQSARYPELMKQTKERREQMRLKQSGGNR